MKSTCTHGEGPAHNCAYVDARNRQLAAAEAHAFKETGEKTTRSFVSTRVFLDFVDERMGTTARGPR